MPLPQSHHRPPTPPVVFGALALLGTAATAQSNLLENGGFEASPFDLSWEQSGTPVVAVAGIAPGSTSAALIPGGSSDSLLGYDIGALADGALSDFVLSYYFTYDGTIDSRVGNLHLRADAVELEFVNFRIDPFGFAQLYTGATWEDVPPASGANAFEAGTVYRMEFAGAGWGTAEAALEIRWTDLGDGSSDGTGDLGLLTNGGFRTPPVDGGQLFGYLRVLDDFGSDLDPGWIVDDFSLTVSGADDDPNIEVEAPSPLFGTLPDMATSAVRTVTVRNTGSANDLTITSAVPEGPDTANYNVATTGFPLTVAPGATTDIEVQFDADGSAFTSFEAVLLIASDDPTSPEVSVDLGATLIDSTASVIENGDFEEPFFPEFWDATAFVTRSQGLLDGSSTSAHIDGTGESLGQFTPTASANWYLDFYFAIPETGNRAMSVFIGIASPTVASVNLRYQSGAFNTFANGSWGGDLGLGTVLPSVDADANGSLDDPGDTKNVYHMRITGSGWGTGDSSYDIQLSEPNTPEFTRSVSGLDRYQNGTGHEAVPAGFSFNTLFGNGPGFWVDDVSFFNVPAADDPNLAVASPLPVFGMLPVGSGAVTRTLTVANAGATQDLVITGATLGGADADHFAVLTDPLPTVPPGGTGAIELSFDPLGESGSFGAQLTLASNDSSTPITPLSLPTAVYAPGTDLVVNGSFEEPGFTDPGWALAGINADFGDPVATPAPGLVVGSTVSARVEGYGSLVGQALNGPSDWHLEFAVAVQEADFRGLQLFVHNLGNATRPTDPAINLTYELGSLAVFDKADGLWVELPELGGLGLSVDADGNGSLDDPADTKAVHRIRITGRDWGSPDAAYEIEVSDAGSDAFTRSTLLPLAFWGGGLGDGRNSPPSAVVFVTNEGDNPGFWVDDVRFTAGLPGDDPGGDPAPLRITSFEVDRGTSGFALTWNPQPGSTYALDFSTDLRSWTLIDSGLAGPTYSDTLLPAPGHYRVREEQ